MFQVPVNVTLADSDLGREFPGGKGVACQGRDYALADGFMPFFGHRWGFWSVFAFHDVNFMSKFLLNTQLFARPKSMLKLYTFY